MVMLLQLRVIANPIVKIFVKCHAIMAKMLSHQIIMQDVQSATLQHTLHDI